MLGRENVTEEDHWLGGKGARLTRNQRKRIKQYLIEKYGAKCVISDCPEPIEANPTLNLEIHHKNGDSSNNFESNLGLAHHACNSRANQKDARPGLEREKKPAGAPGASFEMLKPVSAEIVKNEDYEPIFRRECFRIMLEANREKGSKGVISEKQLRVTAREFVGCSQQTSYSYIERLFSEKGPFEEMIDLATQDRYARFRNRGDTALSIGQLEAKYPKEGKRYSKEI